MISLTSPSEAGGHILSIFPLNIIYASMVIVDVLFGESEMILFLAIAVFLMKKLLDLSTWSSAEIKF